MVLDLDQETILQIMFAAHASDEEACGLLLGHTTQEGVAVIKEVRAIKNISPTPKVSFMYDPQEYHDALIDTTWFGDQLPFTVLGTWHTHPGYPGVPSTVDWDAAMKGQIIEGLYFIYSTLDENLHTYLWDGVTFKTLKRANEET